MYFRKNLSILLIAILLPFFNNNAYATTIDEAIKVALENSKEIKGKSLEVDSADATLSQVRSNYFPKVVASYQSAKAEHNIASYPIIKTPTTTESVSVVQPISDIYKTIPKYKQYKNLYKAAGEDFASTKDDYIIRVVKSYLDVIQYQEILKLNIKNEKNFEQQLEIAKEEYKYGSISNINFATINANFAQSTAKKIEAENNLTTAKLNYENLVGVMHDNLEFPKEQIIDAKNIEDYVSSVISGNHNLQSLNYYAESKKSNLTAAKVDLLPDINLSFSYNKQTNMAYFYPPIPSMTTKVAAINFSMPLFAGGAKVATITKARKDYEIADLSYKVSNERLAMLAKQYWNNYRSITSLVAATEKAVEANGLLLDQRKGEVESGISNIKDENDAEISLLNAEIDLIKARAGKVVISYQMKMLAGN